MIRFIDIGTQMYLLDEDDPQFSFYCTITDKYLEFAEENVWKNERDFISDFLAHIESIYKDSYNKDHALNYVKRYTLLITDKFKK